MARSTEEIHNQIIADIEADDNLNSLTSPSQTALWRTYSFIVAAAINLFEQLMDVFKAEVEQTVLKAIPATIPWWVDQIQRFQYSATVPQNIELVDLVPTYSVVDANLRIASRVAVTVGQNLNVKIKVARNEPPEPFTAPQVTALTDYINTIKPAGISTSIINANPDKLRIEATIYIDGTYAGVAQTNVIAAINGFLSNLLFNGVLKISEIQDVIQAVEGVTDIDTQNMVVQARADGVAFVDRTTIARRYFPFSGYLIEEDEAGNAFADTLTFVIE